MNIANGPNRPLPAVLSPPLTKCYQITLPDDTDWQGAFFDALFQLTYWFAWARDDAHSGRIVAETWLNVLATLRPCKPEQPGDGCCDPGDLFLIRQNPTNPCLIESSADGTHWCTLVDLSLCTAPTGQPGAGGPLPQPGGGEACYHGTLSAAQQWLLPAVVNTGDVLTFTNIQGAGTDGAGLWFCPDGSTFFANACIGGQFTSGGDPDPALHHMAIVAHIGSHYYDITAGPITVPSSISNAQVMLQVNDATLSDNSGDYNFDVCMTNNQAGTWSHDINLALASNGFAIVNGFSCSSGAWGKWTAGTGFEVDNCLNSTTYYRLMQFQRMFSADVTFTSISFGYDAVLGSHANSGNHTIAIEAIAAGGTVTRYGDRLVVTGTGQIMNAGTGFTTRGIGLTLGVDSVDTPTLPDGSARVYTLHVEGTGFDPFV